MRIVTLSLRDKVVAAESNYLNTNDSKTRVEEICTMLLGFRREESNIDELINDNIEDTEGDDAALDYAHAQELRRVHETQIVLVHCVLEHEENHGEYRHVGHQGREHHGDSVGCQSVRHMVSQVESVRVHKLFLVLTSGLLRIVTTFADCAHNHMRDIKQPKTN